VGVFGLALPFGTAAPAFATLTLVSGSGPATITPNAYGPTAAQASTANFALGPNLQFDGKNTQSEVNILVVINADGSLSLYADSSVQPYDTPPATGTEDVLLGVVNKSSSAFSSSFQLSNTKVDIYGFDSDGIDGYLVSSATSGNTKDTSDSNKALRYGGPITYFTGINGAKTSGTINFQSAIAAGASTYFSLEGDPAGVTGGIQLGPVPEPATMFKGAVGALVMGGYGWRKRKQGVAEAKV
jgi:hypothetical protein